MAQKIIRASDGQEVKKPAEDAKKPVEKAKAAPEEKKKPAQNVVQAKPTSGSSIGYRIGAIVLWVLAIACEVLAILVLTGYMYPPFSKVVFLIVAIVLDMAFAIIAAQLWKKANRIKPMSEKNKFLFYLWSELGVIMACICFIPLIVFLLKDNKLDKKSKIIVTIVAIVALLITGVASADFHPVSAEQKEEAETQITQDVYWSAFGHRYHLSSDCYHIRDSATVYVGTVTEAIESGRTAICSYCASHYADGLELEKLNVEEAVEEVPVEEATEPAA